MSRREIYQLDSSFELSHTKVSDNLCYWVPVYDPAGTHVQFKVWMMDSGYKNCLGVRGWGCVEPSQVQWFRENASQGGRGILFCHIPLPEHLELAQTYPYQGRVSRITPSPVNTGLFAAIVETKSV